MTEPIDASVGCLLLYLARRPGSSLGNEYHNVSRYPHFLDAVMHADALDPCPIKHAGMESTMCWPYLRLTPFGEQIVEEMIAAARAVTYDQTQSCG
jgi:hypothetical protein